MKRPILTLSYALSVLVLCVTSNAPVLAATAKVAAPDPSKVGQALEIAPPVITLNANPGQTINTQISLRDISSGSLLVKGQINDFVAAGEDGTPKILIDGEGNNPYSLKNWVSTIPSLIMTPHQIKQLPVTIKVPSNASPGGHYGIVRFSATPPELKGTGVSLSASLGALMLVTVSGPITEKMTVASFTASHAGSSSAIYQAPPLDFAVRLKNEGNIHEQPVGQIAITDMFGKKIANLNINLPPRNVLPGSIRKFTAPLDSTVIGNKRLFGRYHAALTVTYGANKQVVTSSMNFWVIPYRIIAVIIVLLVGGFFALRALMRHYNRIIINKAQNSGSKKPTPKKRK